MIDINKLVLDIGLSRKVIENYIIFADKHYNTYYIDKKSGGKREIDCPGKNLKTIQRWILTNYLNKLDVSKRANGFVKARGIKRNALFHKNKKFILTLDIKDFFCSISQKQVFDNFYENFADRDLALKLAKLCTYKRRLPQGAPTSPLISNLVFKNIDEQITKYCNSELITYSRYADDLTFSSDNKNSLKFAYKFVNEILYENGFNINKKKTRYLSGKGNMSVTGVNINTGSPKVGGKLKKQIRAELHHYIVQKKDINIKRLAGYISYINSIEDDYKEKTKTYIGKLKMIRKLEEIEIKKPH